MRYWIYWNDLVQGPFELDELTTLKALSEDLPVCLEDRTEWIPACRVAELAPIIEERRFLRMPPLPPPPPPTGRPAAEPLQGEFFTEAPNQKWLFPNSDPGKGPFALNDHHLQMHVVYPEVSFTTPFRFNAGAMSQPSARMETSMPTATATATIERPAPAPEKCETPTMFIHNAPEFFPVSKESPVPNDVEELPEQTAAPRIPLEIYPDTPEPAQETPAAFPAYTLGSPVEETSQDRSTWRLAAWITGILGALLLVGVIAYKWFDSSTSRAAIREARHHAAVEKPLVSVPEKITPSEPVQEIVPAKSTKLLNPTKPKDVLPKVKKKKAAAPSPSMPVLPVAPPTEPVELPKARAVKKEQPKDPWRDRSQESIELVMNKNLPKLQQTVSERAQALAEESTYNQKVSWDAIQIAGPLYRVSLIFNGDSAAGAGTSVNVYPFMVDLKKRSVSSEDPETSKNFLKAKKKAADKKNAGSAAATPALTPTPVSTASPTSATSSEVPDVPSVPAAATSVPVAAPTSTVSPVVSGAVPSPAEASSPVPAVAEKPDPWKDRFNDAIALATAKKISTTGQSVGERANVMLEGMHDKELLYAADTGQRLYLPDKMAWSALREVGAAYRVYLGFSADQANGERIQTQSYQFQTNLEHKTVATDDAASAADFLEAKTPLVHKRDPRAADIQNILSAVDLLNKELMRAIIVKDNRKNRLEEKNIAASIKSVMQRFQRAVIYFRTKYPEAMLQNVAKAYSFSKLLKDHV